VGFNSAVVAGRTSVLRRWSVDDGRWYVDQLSDTEIQRFTTESVDTTVEQFQAALRMLTEADEQFGRAIVDSESGELAGNLAAGREADVAYISYWVAGKFRGRGLARQAVEECCTWVEANWPDVDHAQLSIHSDNAASIRVSAATGFVRDPARDKVILVRGKEWPMQAYVRRLRIANG
jgi:RimJ/RimL family protein N-acetyltransferase